MGRGSFLALAKQRKTTYDFTDRPIEEEQLLRILEAGRWAPSCINSQPWHFVVIRNKQLILKIMPHVSYGDFHAPPPVLIAVVLDHTRLHKLNKYSAVLSLNESNIAGGMAAIQMSLEATALGIDSCFLTPDSTIGEFLKIPQKHSLCVLIGLGHEKEGARQKKRGRKPLNEIVFQEEYNPPTE